MNPSLIDDLLQTNTVTKKAITYMTTKKQILTYEN